MKNSNVLVLVNWYSKSCKLFVDNKFVSRWEWDSVDKLCRLYKRYDWYDWSENESFIDLGKRIK